MLTGTVRKVGDGWAIENSYNAFSVPERITVSWRVAGMARWGTSYGPELVDGLKVYTNTGDGDRWTAYSQGGYLYLMTEHEGTIRNEPLPAPRVRAGTETRYQDGGWQKYSKRVGWVAA